MWRHEILAGAFLVLSLTFLSLLTWGYAQHKKRIEIESAYTAQSVELEGAKRALLAKPAEIVKFVEVPAAVKKAVRTGALIPVAATKVAATSKPVEIPCPEPQPETVSEVAPAAHPHTRPVVFGMTGEYFIGKIVGGAVEYTTTIKATASMDAEGDEPAWTTPVEFAPENVKVDVRVSTDIAKAVEQYEAPWTKKHLRFMCPGVFGGIDVHGQVNGGIGCAYGVVW